MKPVKFIFIVFLSVMFFLGLYVYSTGKLRELLFYENMENLAPIPPTDGGATTTANNCPNLLVKRGTRYLLYNTNLPEQAGVNPIMFRSLDDYAVYYKQMQDSGSTCPMVYMQEETDAQGNQVLRARASPFSPYLGTGQNSINPAKPAKYLDSTREHPPFNQNMYPGFDPTDQYVGVYTEIDKVHDSTQKLYNGLSPNPMDANWGGVEFTQNLVDKGVYDENNVMILTA
jgi:hypothetical protein